MLNIEKYENTNDKISKYRKKINVLESIKKDLEELIIDIQDKCNHDLILVFEIDKTDCKLGRCLVCDEFFAFDDNFELFSEKEIDQNKIIDVTKLVSKDNQHRIKNGENVLVIKAQEKLLEMVKFAKNNNRQLELELVKNTIINELIKFDQKTLKEKFKILKK